MMPLMGAILILFLSTLSLRRATASDGAHPFLPGNFYPRSPCGERRVFLKAEGRLAAISIHALLAESDSMMPLMGAILILFLSTLSLRRATQPPIQAFTVKRISIHALLAESDRNWRKPHGQNTIFLSTLSLRRATLRLDR